MDQGYLANLFGLNGRVALVTGGRHGIGAATAVALARAGARVAVTSRERDGLVPVVEQVRAAGSEALPLAMELTCRESIAAAVAATHGHFGRIDILVNNGAVAVRDDSLTYKEEEWDLVYNTNVRGAFQACQLVAPIMMDQGGGSVVNISSIFGRAALGQRAAYGSSKAALDHLTRMLAVEWAPYGIRINGVAPATVITPTREAMFKDPALRAERERRIPMGRLGVPDDVVGAVLFMAGPAAGFVTGHTVMVDGGYTCL